MVFPLAGAILGSMADRTPTTATPPGRVLVVDDEQPLAQMVASYLNRAGFDTRQAHTGTQAVDEALGTAWAAAVARRDRLTAGAGAGDAVGDPALAALRGLHLRVAADVTEERHQRFGAEHPEVILARQGSGFRRVARLDTATAGVLSASDGELSVGQLVGAVAALLELDDVDEEEVEVGSGSWVVDRVVVGSGTGVCVVVIGAGAVVLSVCGR